jgi:protoheme IX farnesyltransferase
MPGGYMKLLLVNQNSSVSVLGRVQNYVAICKTKVVLMLMITAWVGIALAPETGRTWFAQMMSLFGVGVLAAAAAAVNHVVDREIDQKMARTRHRPIATERLTVFQALMFAFVLTLTGIFVLLAWSNLLCTVLTLIALLGYAVVYTIFLKRATPQNIVIGGLAGAMPPLLGWVSETGQLDAEPLLLVMIIFAWTPPHFWALAIARRHDYKRANVPMLPVTHGIQFTQICMIAYTIVLALICVIPYLISMSGWFYLVCSSILNIWFIMKSVNLYLWPSDEKAMALFRFSISYLLLLFIVLFADKWIA